MYLKKDKYFNISALAREIANSQTSKIPKSNLNPLYIVSVKKPFVLTKGNVHLIDSEIKKNIGNKTLGDVFEIMEFHIQNVNEVKKKELQTKLDDLKKFFDEKELLKKLGMHPSFVNKSDLTSEEQDQFVRGIVSTSGSVELDENGLEIL